MASCGKKERYLQKTGAGMAEKIGLSPWEALLWKGNYINLTFDLQ